MEADGDGRHWTRLDPAVVDGYVRRGLLRAQAHPAYPELRIVNYTERVQFGRAWDAVTRECRGLVLGEDGEVVARSFPKFFNFGEVAGAEAEAAAAAGRAFEVRDKVDGSLALLFRYRGEWLVASRGSFESEQARHARALLAARMRPELLDPELTYAFEAVYPANRVVVDYGDRDDLAFLAAFRRDGREVLLPPGAVEAATGFAPAPLAAGVPPGAAVGDLAALDLPGREGFVVRFADTGERVKVKFPRYLRAHRALVHLNTHTVWGWFRDGGSLEDRAESVPDEFVDWARGVWAGLEARRDAALAAADAAAVEVRARLGAPAGSPLSDAASADRRAFAAEARRVAAPGDKLTPRLLFLEADGRDRLPAVVESLRPQERRPPEHRRKGVIVDKDDDDDDSARLTLLCGVPGSGKSAWAAARAAADASVVVVRGEEIRSALWGERAAADAAVRAAVRALLEAGRRVVLDDVDALLSASTVRSYLREFAWFGAAVRMFETPSRDADRTHDETQARRARELRRDLARDATGGATRRPDPIVVDDVENLRDAFVFDVDGTLAINATGRSPFDWSRVGGDAVCGPVRECARALGAAGAAVVVCTGRDAAAEDATRAWLQAHGVPFDELHARPRGDLRPDFAVKEEMWRDVARRFRVRALFDDRRQVVDHARRLGLRVFQVADGDF